MNEIANNPLEKRNEEHYGNLKVAKARIKSLMDKIEFETTPVKWISTKRTRSSQFKMMSEEHNITMPPEWKNRS